MGDPLSVSASIVAVLQLTGTVVQYLNDVKEAPKDRQRILGELSVASGILYLLRDLAKRPQYGDAWSVTIRSLNVPNGPLDQFKLALELLTSKLAPVEGLKKMRKALAWPFHKAEIQSVISMIERQKSIFNLALQNDHIGLSRAIKENVMSLHDGVDDVRSRIIKQQVDEDRYKIIRWLSTSDPSVNHHTACKRHQPKTGEWLIKRDDFEEWKCTQNSLLWLYGIPGCGKTVLSSTIIEHIKGYCDPEPTFAAAYFYFDFNDTEKQSPTSCVSSWIAQLCSQVKRLPQKLKDSYKAYGHQKASLHNLKEMLAQFAVTEELHDIFIVADALDECPRNKERNLRAELLELITEINSWSPSNIHLLITSRLEQDIKEILTSLPTTRMISLHGSQVASDIKLHISSQLSTDPKLRTWPSEEKAHIEKVLTMGAKGMFRWVFCQLDALKKCKKRSALLKALNSLPKTLDDTYARILQSIDEEDQQEARRALLWLAFSEVPLGIEEVAEAAVIDPQSEPPFDPRERLHDPCNDILEILGSLVTVSSNGISNNSDNGPELRLAHFSVKEYLVSQRILNSEVLVFGATDISANQFIGESCLQYILHYSDSDSKSASVEDLDCFPLLHYACRFWYSHIWSVPEGSQDKKDPVFRLFLSDKAFLDWLRVYQPDMPLKRPFQDLNDIGSPLYYASYIGHEAVVRQLLEAKTEVDVKGADGATALHRAVENGHEAVVRLLLEAKADTAAAKDFCWSNGTTWLI